jgi:uncharacterized protein YybS (DUF2232 family)
LPQDQKGIVKDGLLLSGLFLLLLASLVIPFIPMITFWLLPLPFLLLSAKSPSAAMIVSLIVLSVAFVFFPAPFFVLSLFAWFMGSVMGHSYRSSKTTGTDVVLSGIVSGVVGSWVILYLGQVFHLFDWVRAVWEKESLQMEEMLKEAGAGAQTMAVLGTETMIPPLVFSLIILMALITFFAARRWLLRQGFHRKTLPAFYEWRLPKVFFYFYLLALILALFYFPSGGGGSGMISALAILHELFLIQGFAFIHFLLHRRGKSGGWLIPLVLVSFITPFSLLIQFLGMIDTATLLRQKLNK